MQQNQIQYYISLLETHVRYKKHTKTYAIKTHSKTGLNLDQVFKKPSKSIKADQLIQYYQSIQFFTIGYNIINTNFSHKHWQQKSIHVRRNSLSLKMISHKTQTKICM